MSTDQIRLVLVVIPARNEAALLGNCLRSVALAAEHVASEPIRVVTTVVLDCCTDSSAAIAAQFADIDIVESRAGRVGSARACGVEHAVAQHVEISHHGVNQQSPHAVWLAMTDADSVVAPDWLAVHCAYAAAGADVLLGTVEPDRASTDGQVWAAWRSGYFPRDGHRYVHGANLGVRLSTYRAAGGFAPLEAHEDVALVSAARAAGARVRSTGRAPVVTSGRLRGRTPDGFAQFLAGLDVGLDAGLDVG